MNPYRKSNKRALIKLSSPSTFMDADGEGFSANNLQSTKIIFCERRFHQKGGSFR